VAALVAAAAAAQTRPATPPPPPPPASSFADEVSVAWILVPVTVKSRAGYVRGLDKEDFELKVDGRRIDSRPIEEKGVSDPAPPQGREHARFGRNRSWRVEGVDEFTDKLQPAVAANGRSGKRPTR